MLKKLVRQGCISEGFLCGSHQPKVLIHQTFQQLTAAFISGMAYRVCVCYMCNGDSIGVPVGGGARSPIEWQPVIASPPVHKDGRATDSCFALIGAHLCDILIVDDWMTGCFCISTPVKHLNVVERGMVACS